ncbi:MAG: antibiotic biosynthesis monooxygenase [Acidobacteria bacterium]|nr:antibiotic biosynthesis monooxygenase [Acidobacteriota bacterium]
MRIVTGVFQLDPSDVDAFLESRKAAMKNSRAEKGCLEYVMAADPLDPGRVILSERWESRADLDAHIAAMRSAPPEPDAAPPVKMISREVWRFEVVSSEPMT